MTPGYPPSDDAAIVDPGSRQGAARGIGGAVACPGCAKPDGSSPVHGCRKCELRELARGPLFWESMMANKLTPAYVAALMRLGPDVSAVHEEVKAAAKTITIGSTPA